MHLGEEKTSMKMNFQFVPRGAICFLVGAIHQNDACRIPSRVEELKRMELILYRIS